MYERWWAAVGRLAVWGHSCSQIARRGSWSRTYRTREASCSRAAGVYVGTLPADQNIANTAFAWSGVRWTQVVWPLADDVDAPRRHVCSTRCFHRVQPGPRPRDVDDIEQPARDDGGADLAAARMAGARPRARGARRRVATRRGLRLARVPGVSPSGGPRGPPRHPGGPAGVQPACGSARGIRQHARSPTWPRTSSTDRSSGRSRTSPVRRTDCLLDRYDPDVANADPLGAIADHTPRSRAWRVARRQRRRTAGAALRRRHAARERATTARCAAMPSWRRIAPPCRRTDRRARLSRDEDPVPTRTR